MANQSPRSSLGSDYHGSADNSALSLNGTVSPTTTVDTRTVSNEFASEDWEQWMAWEGVTEALSPRSQKRHMMSYRSSGIADEKTRANSKLETTNVRGSGNARAGMDLQSSVGSSYFSSTPAVGGQTPQTEDFLDSPSMPRSKKRKSLVDEGMAPSHCEPPAKHNPHNLIEKRYRNKINDQITQLRDSVPKLRDAAKSNHAKDTPKQGANGMDEIGTKLNKATILTKATEYIHELEKRNSQLNHEIARLQDRLQVSQGMEFSMSSSPRMRKNRQPIMPEWTESIEEDPPSSKEVRGLIKVPECMSSLRVDPSLQEHYGDSITGKSSTTQTGGGDADAGSSAGGSANFRLMGKIMVGSLAGLMIMHEFIDDPRRETNESRRRGLFAIPTQVLSTLLDLPSLVIRHAVFSISGPFNRQLLPLGKVAMGVILIYFAVFLYLFNSKPKSKKESLRKTSLSAAPSLTSPLDVRQKAWLTSLQTVWVPEHRVLPEMLALLQMTVKYSLRQLLGIDGYLWLTRGDQDTEIARTRAWDIAIDAQLAGGDAEISKSRIVLTIFAAGTLPDSPTRLMLKAIHVRILLWEALRSQWSVLYPMHRLAAFMARHQWHVAQTLQRKTDNSSNDTADGLPEYLKRLLELDCDQVMTQSVVQRAHNLAWNRPTREDTEGDDIGMDSVTEDHAIHSPLDALAAWWSSDLLYKCLLTSLDDMEHLSDSFFEDLELAASIAPPGSSAQTRAMAVKALFVKKDRDQCIAAVMQALPPSNTVEGGKNHVRRKSSVSIHSSTPVLACNEVQIPVRCAIALSTLSEKPYETRSAADILAVIPLDSHSLSLLEFVAAFYALYILITGDVSAEHAPLALKQQALKLVEWTTSATAKRSGLDDIPRTRVAKHCAKMAHACSSRRRVSSASADTGYASMSSDAEDLDPVAGS
ncbi:hypothetical protein MMC09_000097 [Bachmanniomyces sp. S44760]|nr:hypothetical protein [Bachmanniomyces sp. S44760]